MNMNKLYHPVMCLLWVMTAIMTMVMVSWLFTTTNQDTYSCTLCWKERMELVRRWVKKILFIPTERICRISCKAHLKQLALAILMYASDHNGYLPNHLTWEQQVFVYLKNRYIYECPGTLVRQPYYSYYYCMNSQLSGKNLKEITAPEKTVLLFECDAKGNPVTRHHFMEFRHLCYVAFVNGHVEGYRLIRR